MLWNRYPHIEQHGKKKQLNILYVCFERSMLFCTTDNPHDREIDLLDDNGHFQYYFNTPVEHSLSQRYGVSNMPFANGEILPVIVLNRKEMDLIACGDWIYDLDVADFDAEEYFRANRSALVDIHLGLNKPNTFNSFAMQNALIVKGLSATQAKDVADELKRAVS